jgi:TIR domain
MAATLFISYSRADMQDFDWLARLRMYLSPFRRSGSVDVWDDSRIPPGSQWEKEITQALDNAAAAVLLVGPGFLASDFVVVHELPSLLKSAQARGVSLFPLVIGFCSYDESELGAYQAFNSPAKPLESLPPPERNRILNELAVAIYKKLRTDSSQVRQDRPSTQDLYGVMKLIQRLLVDTGTAFAAQCRRRNDLVAAIEKRLNFKNTLEYEKFFLRYHSQLTEAERFEFDQIRAITEGSLQKGNRKILELIENNPKLLDLVPQITGLRQHLVFWLNKYDKVFTVNRAMCLLYTGVEDGVPFPAGLDDAVSTWLRTHNG